MVKVICAGPPKTGTKSMTKALRILGYNEVWDYEEALEYGFEEWEGILQNKETTAGRVIEKYSKTVEAVVDLPHSHFFELFLERWPDAKVILMIREEEKWFNSFKYMMERAEKDHPILMKLQYITPTSYKLMRWHTSLFTTVWGSEKANPLKWKMWFRRHNVYVKSVVPPKQLLVYDVNEGWKPLCSFLDKEVPEDEFPFENKADSKQAISERIIENTTIVKRMIKEAFVILIVGPILLAAIAYYLFKYM